MRIGNFEVNEPLPHLKTPHVIANLGPWIDCGSVGTLVLKRMETVFRARELAKLSQPGAFYDFTRYRPTSSFENGVRKLIIPNTTISWTRTEAGNDFIFLHMLEPHALSETFTNSVWQVLKKLEIKRYCLLGSFYDMVPHTRPILISGGASGTGSEGYLKNIGVQRSNYQGPTTICNLISQEAEKAGIETMSFMVHLPQYTELEEDYMGTIALLQVLYSLYRFPISESDINQAEAQKKGLDAIVQKDRKIKALVSRLESYYDDRVASQKGEEEPQLSPEVDNFLKEMENRFKEN
jgi:hypothetical protein